MEKEGGKKKKTQQNKKNTLAGNSLLPCWCTQKVFRIKTFRIKIVKKQRHSDGGKFSLLYFCFFMFCILA